MEEILKEWKIEREVYNGHAFTGEMCLILMHNIKGIMRRIKVEVGAYTVCPSLTSSQGIRASFARK